MRLSRRTVGTMGSLQGEKTSRGARTLLFLAKLPPSFPHFHHTRSERRSASMRAYHYRYPVRLSQEHRLWLETMRRTSRTPAKHYLVAISLTRSPLRLIPLTIIRTKYKILHPIGRFSIFGYIRVFFFSRVLLSCLINSTPNMAAFVPLWDFTQYCLFVDRRQIISTLKISVYFHPISA